MSIFLMGAGCEIHHDRCDPSKHQSGSARSGGEGEVKIFTLSLTRRSDMVSGLETTRYGSETTDVV